MAKRATPVMRTCTVCGFDFETDSYKRTTCGDDCARIAQWQLGHRRQPPACLPATYSRSVVTGGGVGVLQPAALIAGGVQLVDCYGGLWEPMDWAAGIGA